MLLGSGKSRFIYESPNYFTPITPRSNPNMQRGFLFLPHRFMFIVTSVAIVFLFRYSTLRPTMSFLLELFSHYFLDLSDFKLGFMFFL